MEHYRESPFVNEILRRLDLFNKKLLEIQDFESLSQLSETGRKALINSLPRIHCLLSDDCDYFEIVQKIINNQEYFDLLNQGYEFKYNAQAVSTHVSPYLHNQIPTSGDFKLAKAYIHGYPNSEEELKGYHAVFIKSENND